jgi:8-amino-7-oxononanoate synthase
MSLDWINAELAAKENAGLLRRRRTFHPHPDGTVEVEGRRLLNLAGNDYLGLAGDPRVLAAANAAIGSAGFGARASALVAGRTEWHERLERQLAEFEAAEAAILFPTGYAANVGTIVALAGPDDAVFCDRLNHASLIDGCRLSQARFRVYPHLDVETLDRELAKVTDVRRRLIVTDAIFSMDGDVAPLLQLHELARMHDAMLLIDEAHATGVLGNGGRGLAEHFGIPPGRIIRTGTLSKAVGSVGGFVAGERHLIDWLWNTARPQVFSTAMPPACAAAAAAAIEIIQSEPQRRERLIGLSRSLRSRLSGMGLNVPSTFIQTPIIPVIIGEEAATMSAAAALEDAGFLVGSIRPPTVPRGTSRLRISLHAAVTEADLDRLVESLSQIVPAAPQ